MLSPLCDPRRLPRQSAELAHELIAATCDKASPRGQLTLHADRGSSMRSKPVAFLLADLGVTKTHSRPHTSDDNPYSESQFKTVSPRVSRTLRLHRDGRAFSRRFFEWYNRDHHHSGIGLLTPEVVHYGRAEEVIRARHEVLLAAYEAHPERFVKTTRTAAPASSSLDQSA